MPLYIYWGEDDFAMQRQIAALCDRVLDPLWSSFNFDKIPPEQPDALIQALNQAVTPPFGAGQRLIWLVNTPLLSSGAKGSIKEDHLAELERTLPNLPDTTVFLLTLANKPDSRLKLYKLLERHAGDKGIQEFSPIPPWKADLLLKRTQQAAQEMGVKLTHPAIELLAEAVGNDSRQLYMELEKLRLYATNQPQPLDTDAITRLVTTSTQNSLKLAEAIREGKTAQALSLVADLIHRNEPALKILATLTGQFRTWLWVKLMVASGERDERTIAQAAEIGNPKRIYFLRKEIGHITLDQLQSALPILLELEVQLKKGAEELPMLQTYMVRLCTLFAHSDRI